MTSGVPPGSVLSSFYFVLNVNNMHENVQSNICKFADYTRVGHSMDSEDGYQKLLLDPDQLGKRNG